MLIALWILNTLLALAFLMAGLMKVARPKQALASAGLAWVDDFSAGTVKLIGAAEAIGAVGLIVPLLTGVVPLLTPIAAAALAVLMLGATVVHARRRESFIPALALAVLSVASAVLGFVVVAG